MLILKEWAQAAPDAPVRVEVLEVIPRGSIAIKVDPILDEDIGDGSGAWTTEDLLAAVSKQVGEEVLLPEKENGN